MKEKLVFYNSAGIITDLYEEVDDEFYQFSVLRTIDMVQKYRNPGEKIYKITVEEVTSDEGFYPIPPCWQRRF